MIKFCIENYVTFKLEISLIFSIIFKNLNYVSITQDLFQFLSSICLLHIHIKHTQNINNT